MERTFTISDLISIFLRRLWLIVIMAILGGTVSYLYSEYVIPKKYTSSVTMYVYNQANDARALTTADFILSLKLVNTYLVILKSNQVLEAVSTRIQSEGLKYTPEQIRSMIKSQSVEETEVFEVSVSCANKEHAAIIADKLSIVAPGEIIRVVKAGAVEVVDKAQIPKSHSSPNITQNTFIGILLGLALAAGLSFLLELMNTSIKSKEDLVETYQIPVLTLVPNFSNETGKNGYKYYRHKYEYGYGYGYENVKTDKADGGKHETSK